MQELKITILKLPMDVDKIVDSQVRALAANALRNDKINTSVDFIGLHRGITHAN
jgi:hypothetical protein